MTSVVVSSAGEDVLDSLEAGIEYLTDALSDLGGRPLPHGTPGRLESSPLSSFSDRQTVKRALMMNKSGISNSLFIVKALFMRPEELVRRRRVVLRIGKDGSAAGHAHFLRPARVNVVEK